MPPTSSPDDAWLLRAAEALAEVRVHSKVEGLSHRDVAAWLAVRSGARPWVVAELTGRRPDWFLAVHKKMRGAVRYAPASRFYNEVTNAMQLLKALAGFDPALTAAWGPTVGYWQKRLA